MGNFSPCYLFLINNLFLLFCQSQVTKYCNQGDVYPEFPRETRTCFLSIPVYMHWPWASSTWPKIRELQQVVTLSFFTISNVCLVHVMPADNCIWWSIITWIPWNLLFRYIHCTSQFTPKMKANAEPRLLSSLVWIDSGVVVSQHCLESCFHEIKCNGMTSFMESML